MSDVYEIAAEKRERAGKGIARALRREGLVPAVIYGDKKDPEGIALNLGEVKKLFNTGRMMNTLLDIEIKEHFSTEIIHDLETLTGVTFARFLNHISNYQPFASKT